MICIADVMQFLSLQDQNILENILLHYGRSVGDGGDEISILIDKVAPDHPEVESAMYALSYRLDEALRIARVMQDNASQSSRHRQTKH